MNLGLGDIIGRMEQAVGRNLTDCLLFLAYGAACVGILAFAAEEVTTLIESPSIGQRALGWLFSSIVLAILSFGVSKITTRRVRALLSECQEVQAATLEIKRAATLEIERAATQETEKAEKAATAVLRTAAEAQAAALAEQAKCRELHAICLEWEEKIEAARKVVEPHQP